jgi:F-type H+-transporting ATPase subunit a
MATENVFEHVKDSTTWEFFPTLGWELHLPKVATVGPNAFAGLEGHAGYGIYLTKFMVLELLAGLLCLALAIPAARRVRCNLWPMGLLANVVEAVLLFIRDEIARQAIRKPEHHHDEGQHHAENGEHRPGSSSSSSAQGPEEHPADRFVPYLASAFWFILICNLLGLVPFGASPTQALGCTGALALCTLGIGLWAAVQESGWRFYQAFVPPLELPLVLKLLLLPMMFAIEVIGFLIRHGTLAVRLFANMMGGHTVLHVILGFVVAEKVLGNWFLFPIVAAGSTLGAVAISLLELLVALLQAYIFTFLSAVYIGMLVYPEH